MTSPASALALVAGLLAAGPAAAQVASIDSRNSPASLRCSALGQIDEAERPAAVYFMAGYSSGERDATAFATVGAADTLGADVPQGGSEQAGGSTGESQAQQSAESGGADANEAPAEAADAADGEAAADEPAEAAAPEAPAEDAEAATEQPAAEAGTATSGPTGGPPAAVLPTVPVEAILAACAQSPDSRIIDIIVAQGALGTD